MKKLNQRPEVGWFLVRLGLAAVFIVHGWAKLADLPGTVGFFSALGLPTFLAYVVAVIEFGGGLAMLLGIFARVAGALLAIVMLGAIITVKFKLGFTGGYEFDLMLLLAALAVAAAGPGRLSIKR